MVWVDLLDSVGGLKTLLGGYFGHFSPISCLNVSHSYIHYMYLRRLSQAQNPFRVSHGSPYLPT
ncbi:unknown protein [Microcystis aeruginosa NIES-843]|uniref:Uncharacterized protein n=1 Tax=Microcystis aeruginosa (strain NIES-843 / IAM M-2473) TaxID=449447 RepID=B0JLY5_MICAN|nr:unknown protein [Microcystis aeruginosa NIES-843]